MKKLLYLFAIILITFISCNKEEEVVEEDCGCVKTTRQSGSTYQTATRYVITSVENVPCQDNNIPYVFVSGNRATGQNVVIYSICCDNIDDPNSECN
tara:strand:- start:1201 stop:1491 length:291 start_codon:yes stop_codon:yes gene_type:complete